MSLIKRFPLRTKLYDKILENPAALAHLDYFFRPLFNQDGEKSYNLNKAFQLQRPNRKRQEADSGETLDFNEELWQQEKERRRREKLKRYEGSLRCLLSYVMENGEVTLKEIGKRLAAEGEEGGEEINRLIPNVEVFKEIMVELIKNREIDLDALQKERSQFIQDKPEEFQLNDMLLTLAEGDGPLGGIRKLEVYRTGSGEAVVFAGVRAEDGTKKQIRCSDVLLRAVGRGDEEGLGRKG